MKRYFGLPPSPPSFFRYFAFLFGCIYAVFFVTHFSFCHSFLAFYWAIYWQHIWGQFLQPFSQNVACRETGLKRGKMAAVGTVHRENKLL
jgi:hypothetical protein